MRYLSLFSGIEAASVAWHSLGWKCVGVSEIEAFPCAVLEHHYPGVPNFGDVTKITEKDIAELGQIDVIVFGSPCQDLSLAGKRKGFIDDCGTATRSGLFFTAMQIVEWAKKHCGLRFALWENVLGAFSSNKGADFAEVVGHLAGIDYVEIPPKGWGSEGCAVGKEGMVEWSTLDAQWFGVAQRRRRVFALADFGDWSNRPPLLLEPESMRGDTAPSRKTGQETTVATTVGTGESRPCSRNAESGFVLKELIAFNSNAQPDEMRFDEHVSATLTCSQNAAVAFSAKDYGGDATENLSPTLRSGNSHCSNQNSGNWMAVAYSTKLHNTASNQAGKFYEEYTVGLDRSSPTPAVIAAFKGGQGSSAGGIGYDEHTSPTLTSADSGSNRVPALLAEMQVRRLTPVECERLQGFPDNYTAIPWRGKPADMCPDGPRYKAIGNSMAVPVMRWIGKQLDLMRFF